MNVESAKHTLVWILLGIIGCLSVLFLYFPSSVNFELTGNLYQQSETAGTPVCGVGHSKTGILGISFQTGAV